MGSPVIFAFAFSILIALFWLNRFRKMDKYEKEPERLVYLAFFAGAVAIFPSAFLESFAILPSHPSPTSSQQPFPYLLMGGDRRGIL